EFYISEKVTSIDFLRTKLVAGTTRHDFEVIDIDTLVTQPLVDPDSTLYDSKTMKCVAVLRVGSEALLCYHSFAIFTDTQGRPTAKQCIKWRADAVHAVGLYLIAFGPDHIEVRFGADGTLVQTIWIKHTLLCVSQEMCTIQTLDGRLLGLHFSASLKAVHEAHAHSTPQE
ncbi:hypothetical protein H0H81_008541, partial [Sphagnurus paluster]